MCLEKQKNMANFLIPCTLTGEPKEAPNLTWAWLSPRCCSPVGNKPADETSLYLYRSVSYYQQRHTYTEGEMIYFKKYSLITKEKRAGIAILISDKTNLKTKTIQRVKCIL